MSVCVYKVKLCFQYDYFCSCVYVIYNSLKVMQTITIVVSLFLTVYIILVALCQTVVNGSRRPIKSDG